jgi:D-alanyl-D-alanine carboxypeptidase (penicillin-binding protein 5/6)
MGRFSKRFRSWHVRFVRSIQVWCVLFIACWVTVAQAAVPPITLDARQWVLIDARTGEVLASKDAEQPAEPASITKLMTAYVVFGALRDGRLKLEQQVPVSTTAWKMGGSRMFIDPKMTPTVEELLRGMIIQSGNDASVALAEAVAGSEEAFTALMNDAAKKLGLKNSHFMNSTGMPDPQHYMSAHDIALLARAIIEEFPQFYALYSEKEYVFNGIRQPNRNRLLWLDPSVDGIKTGHTSSAGYCLASSARREGRRLIAVVLGAPSDEVRVQESLKLLNYGFQFFDAVKLYDANQAVATLRVWKGVKREIPVGFTTDVVLTLPREDVKHAEARFIGEEPLLAPVSKGQPVGKVEVSVEGKPLTTLTAVALDDVPQAGWFGRAWDALVLWIKSW